MTLQEREREATARAARMTIAVQTVALRRGLDPQTLTKVSPGGWREALYLGEWWESVARLKETASRFHFGPYGTDSPKPFGLGERIVMKDRVSETRRILARLREATRAHD